MPDTHDIETTLEVDVRVEYTLARGQKGSADIYHPDAEPDEPDRVEIQKVWLGSVDIQAGLTEDLIGILRVDCESDAENNHD